MFYRLFIVFDSGIYLFTTSKRPDIDPKFDLNKALKKIREANVIKPDSLKVTGKTKQVPSSKEKKPEKKEKQAVKKEKPLIVVDAKEEEIVLPPKKEVIPYPSKRIYTGKDNNIVINLPDFTANKYEVRFYDEENKPLFVLNKLTEGYFIIEKVNFFHAGWFYFEIFDEGILLEKNKFFIPKD
jgi:hypothetical protein